MKKRRIVLASLLKPINDTRMFEKMGVSLAACGKYDVHIIGYPPVTELSETIIQFHQLPKFKRLSLGRFRARLKTLQFCLQVKPELLIATTHELLVVAVLIRILFGTKIMYDIQENYCRNILYTDAFPSLFRPLIAFFVRLKEWVLSPLISQFLLAEKGYMNELGFIKNKFLVIENKCKVPPSFERKPDKEFIELIFTGTIAESTGVFQVIDLAEKLHSMDSRIRLRIIGYCAQANVLKQIEREVSKNPFIALVGGKELVDHATIMDAIATASFGIISYPHSAHTESKIPTKLYEYMACELPMLLQNHKPWVELSDPFQAAIQVEFEQPDVNSILKGIHSGNFYYKKPVGMTWESEERKLLALVNNFFRLA